MSATAADGSRSGRAIRARRSTSGPAWTWTRGCPSTSCSDRGRSEQRRQLPRRSVATVGEVAAADQHGDEHGADERDHGGDEQDRVQRRDERRIRSGPNRRRGRAGGDGSDELVRRHGVERARERGGDPMLEDRAQRRDAGRDPDLTEGVVRCRTPCRPAPAGRRPTAVEASGGFVAPIPIPATTKPASSAVQPELVVSPCISRSDAPTSASPTERRRRTGSRAVSLPGDRRGDERRRARSAGSADRLRAPSSRACSGGRASGRGTSRTSTTRARTPPPVRPRTRGRGTGEVEHRIARASLDDDEGHAEHHGRSPARLTMNALYQPRSFPSSSARRAGRAPPSTSPGRASRAARVLGSLDSCSREIESAIAASPIGTLTKKIHRHRSRS